MKLAALAAVCATLAAAAPLPIAVDAVNPRYLRFRGKTGPLIAAGEHYRAVLNPRFDYVKYLDTLRDNGFNLTRIFNVVDNAFFDAGEQYAPALAVDAYFTRLKAFVAEAAKRNIAVEVTLFSAQYGNGREGFGSWNLNPMNTGAVLWDRFNTLENPALTAAQDALVGTTVTALNDFDNVYFEICNEPYFSGATARQTRDWSNHMAATITATESKLPLKHLIAENVLNPDVAMESANGVSILNLHTSSAALALNAGLKKPVALDETTDACSSPARRQEAWAFLMSGGAVYNNTDPSFTAEDPTGSNTQPNCAGVRYELRNLATFLNGLDMQRMKPNRDALRQWPLYAGEAWMLEDPGHVYAIYLKGGHSTRISTLLLDVPAGSYRQSWLNTRTGELDELAATPHPGGSMKIQTPAYDEDLALKLVRLPDPEKPKPAPQPKAPARPVRRARRS